MKDNMAYVAVIDGPEYRLGIAKQGETGYYKTDLPSFKTYREASDMADRFNSGLGLDKTEAAKIVLGSMRKEPETLDNDDLSRLIDILEMEILAIEGGYASYVGIDDEEKDLKRLREISEKIENMLKAGA